MIIMSHLQEHQQWTQHRSCPGSWHYIQRMRNGLMLKTTAIPPPGCSNLSGCFHLKARCCPATRYARPLQPARLSVRASAYSPEQETDDASEPPRDAGGIEGMLQATQENVREAQDSKNGGLIAPSRTSMSFAEARRAQERARRVLTQAEADCAISPEHSSTHGVSQAPGSHKGEEVLGRKEYMERMAEGGERSLTPDSWARSWAEEEAFYARGGHGYSSGGGWPASGTASRSAGSGSVEGASYSSSDVDEADREMVLRELAELVDGSAWGRVSGGGSTTPVMAYEEIAQRLREAFPTSQERQQARTAAAPHPSDHPLDQPGAQVYPELRNGNAHTHMEQSRAEERGADLGDGHKPTQAGDRQGEVD